MRLAVEAIRALGFVWATMALALRSARSHDHGAVAQLVAHLHGMQGVRGSSPLSSTEFVETALEKAGLRAGFLLSRTLRARCACGRYVASWNNTGVVAC